MLPGFAADTVTCGRVMVALSGGADSVALLHAVMSLNGDVCAAHINHGLRGDESEGDARFCAGLCAELGIALRIINVDAASKAKSERLTIEQAARAARYAALESARASFRAERILTAHHMGDNCETALIRLFRGTGAAGFSGIPFTRGYITRPLLYTPKAEILKYCADNNLRYVSDSSNSDNKYTRNYIRNEILPMLKGRLNNNIEETVCRAARLAAQDDDFMTAEARRALHNISSPEGLDTERLKSLHPAIARRVIRLEIERARGDIVDISEKNISDALSLLYKQSGRRVSIGGGYVIARQFNAIKIYKPPPPISYEYPLPPGEWVYISEAGVSVKTGSSGLAARTRMDGDAYRGKKLKSYIVKQKIPIERRNSMLLIADGKEALHIHAAGNYGRFNLGDSYVYIEEGEHE